MTTRKESPHSLSVGRLSSTTEDGRTLFALSVEDTNTGHKLFEVEIEAGELMLAIANLMSRPCKVNFSENGMALRGKKREVMSHKVLKRQGGGKLSKKLVAEGWEIWHGYGNHHAQRTDDQGRQVYLCTLVRYTDMDDFEPEILP